MSDEEHARRRRSAELYVARVTFLCPDGCAGWQHHAEALLYYLLECVDADHHGDEREPLPDTGIAHLHADLARHRDAFDARWSATPT